MQIFHNREYVYIHLQSVDFPLSLRFIGLMDANFRNVCHLQKRRCGRWMIGNWRHLDTVSPGNWSDEIFPNWMDGLLICQKPAPTGDPMSSSNRSIMDGCYHFFPKSGEKWIRNLDWSPCRLGILLSCLDDDWKVMHMAYAFIVVVCSGRYWWNIHTPPT